MTAPASTAVIRQWARDKGLEVGDRGRLSPQILTAYAESGSSSLEAPDEELARTLDQSPRSHVRRPVRICVEPTPGANGIRHRITARNN